MPVTAIAGTDAPELSCAVDGAVMTCTTAVDMPADASWCGPRVSRPVARATRACCLLRDAVTCASRACGVGVGIMLSLLASC
jgi:hypothetical protein